MQIAALLLLSTMCIGPPARKQRGPQDDNSRMVHTISLNALEQTRQHELFGEEPQRAFWQAPLLRFQCVDDEEASREVAAHASA